MATLPWACQPVSWKSWYLKSKAQWSEFKKVYVDLARRYPDELQDLE